MIPQETDKYGDIYLARKAARGLTKPYSQRTFNCMKRFVAGDVLEIGPGAGDNINLLANPCIDSYMALEPDERLYGELQRNILLAVEKNLYLDSFPSGNIKGRRFDTILSFEVIEHVQDGRAFLDECKRVIKPEGYIIVSTPNKYIYRAVAHIADGGPDPTHINEMTYRKFRKLFSSYFRIVYSNYTLPLFPRLADRLGNERLFSASEALAGMLRFASLNVMLVGTAYR